MYFSEICAFLICVVVSLSTRGGFAEHHQEDYFSENRTDTQINHTSTDDTPMENHTQIDAGKEDHFSENCNDTQMNHTNTNDAIENRTQSTSKDEHHRSEEIEAAEGHNTSDSNKHLHASSESDGVPAPRTNISLEHNYDKGNVTTYLQNVTKDATDEVISIWQNQSTYLNDLGRENTIIFQTYKVELKRITYLLNRTHELIKKHGKILPSVNWDEKDEKKPRPFHDEVIGQLAKNWDEIERYFRENKLRGVDVSVKRINRLVQSTKEEVNNGWDRLKKLKAEMERLKALL